MKVGSHARWSLGVLVCGISLAGCGGELGEADASANPGGVELDIPDASSGLRRDGLATINSAQLWPQGSTITACWNKVGTFDGEKAIIQSSINKTWLSYGNIYVTWDPDCENHFSADASVIRAQVDWLDYGSDGFTRFPGGMGAKAQADARSMHIWVRDSGYDVYRLEYLAVHEWGHVLGFGHEQDRTDINDGCDGGNPATGTYWTPFDHDSIMQSACNIYDNNWAALSDWDRWGMVGAYGAGEGGLILNDAAESIPVSIGGGATNGSITPGMALNAYGGARDGGPLRVVNNCPKTNPDCTWTYKDGMILSDSNPVLAINAWSGADAGILRLNGACTKTNANCTWTYTQGMFVSDANPAMAIMADGKTNASTVSLRTKCASNDETCKWTYRNVRIRSNTSSAYWLNSYGGTLPGAKLRFVNNCTATNRDCVFSIHKGKLESASGPMYVGYPDWGVSPATVSLTDTSDAGACRGENPTDPSCRYTFLAWPDVERS